jgi:hypothetical protein
MAARSSARYCSGSAGTPAATAAISLGSTTVSACRGRR